MRRSAICLLMTLALGATGAATPALAQDAPPFDAARVPATGRQTHDFVPGGWKAAAEATGDLNGDGRADHVLHLVPAGSWYSQGTISAAPDAQALLILLADANGRLRRAGVATKMLVPVVPQYILELTIRNGVLIVHQNYGMTEVQDLTHRFRRDPATGRFVLIGRDEFFYTRPQEAADSRRVSENYLTGVRLTTIGHWGSGDTARETTTRERIPRTKTDFEAVDENDEG
ncbi:hypothetical protein [Longimicrobium sp.]|uniref:hypothetical protein n=1 Tax=Longimicrobium sp. TaxID=2029185 RepID=UPI002B736CCE|nr:hypothetical protein [Longimicrobium sp.]HSU16088.1 hypothetical protein [Longimicrobium sp.]